MQIGVVFPQTEFGDDVGAVRALRQGRRGTGLPAPHRLRPHTRRRSRGDQDLQRPDDMATTTFHEPLVLFGYLAALTRLELVTSVLVLPQRQTALVAKQAAEVDLLTGGPLAGSAWASAGTESSTRASVRTSQAAGRAWRSISTCFADS